MKNSIIAFLLVFSGAALQAQSNCTMFYPFKEGIQMEYTYFDKKDKVENKAINSVREVKTTPNGVEAVVVSQIFNSRDEEQFAGEYQVRCENGVVKMDVSTMLNPTMQQSFANMELDIEGEDFTLPGTMKEGQQMPDAGIEIKAGARGVNIVDMTVRITDRKVIGQEVVSTPAGTFDCYKVSRTTDVQMMLGKSFRSVEYYAEGFGLVRSETYDKDGELEEYMVLTAFKK